MADDEGRGTVLDLPLVRLFAPPEARPPDDLTTNPEPADGSGYPTLAPGPAAVPPDHLSLPDAIVPGDDETPIGTLLTRASGPGESRSRTAMSTAMVIAAATAVVCLRGCASAVEWMHARAEHHQAVRSRATGSTGTGGTGGGGSGRGTGRVPSSLDYGRRSTGHHGHSPSGGRAGGRGGGTLGLGTGPGGRAAGRAGAGQHGASHNTGPGGRHRPGGTPARLGADSGSARRDRRHRDPEKTGGAKGSSKSTSGSPLHGGGRAPGGARSPHSSALAGRDGSRDGKSGGKRPKHHRNGVHGASGQEGGGRAGTWSALGRRLTPTGRAQARTGRATARTEALAARGRLRDARRADRDERRWTRGGRAQARDHRAQTLEADTASRQRLREARRAAKEDRSETRRQRMQRLRERWDRLRHRGHDHDQAAPDEPGPDMNYGPWSHEWADYADRRRERGRRKRPTGPEYGEPGDGLRPPPGWTVDYTVTVTREPTTPDSGQESGPAGVTTGARGLPRVPEQASGPRPGTSSPNHQHGEHDQEQGEEGHPDVSTPPVRLAKSRPMPATTQYADSDLTIGDVIDADADMAEEILAGAEHAKIVAVKCEALSERLEALHAKVQELKVPGVLNGMVARLMEKADGVKTSAEAVAQTLPRASEAIAAAGANAERRHRPLADKTRDMGHVAPAERDYHKE